MKSLRYLLDENVDPQLAAGLLRREPDLTVWRIGTPGAPQKGTADPDILRWCEEHAFILVTNNRKSMPGHLGSHLAAGGYVPGIIALNPSLNMGATIEELWLIWSVSDVADFADRILYLPL